MLNSSSLVLGIGFYLSQFRGDIPAGAVAGGRDSLGVSLYLGAAQTETGFTTAFISVPGDTLTYSSKGVAATTNLLTFVTLEEGCKAAWLPATNGQLPPNPVVLGSDGTETFYIGRASMSDSSILMGRIVQSLGALVVPYGPGEQTVTNFEALTLIDCLSPIGTRLYLAQSQHDTPTNAIVAGTNIDQSVVYVGLSRYESSLIPTSVLPADGSMSFSYNGAAVLEKNKQIYLALADGYTSSWVPGGPNAPANVVQLGMDKDIPYYVGRAVNSKQENVVGKIVKGAPYITFPSDNKEVLTSEFEYLTISKIVTKAKKSKN